MPAGYETVPDEIYKEIISTLKDAREWIQENKPVTNCSPSLVASTIKAKRLTFRIDEILERDRRNK